MKPRLVVFCVLAVGVAIAPRHLIAQQGALEEIIVTARKREESVQDVPIAISAFTSDDIREMGLDSVNDIALYTPGFSFHSGFGRQPQLDRPAVRGQTTILNGIAGVKAVSTFVDGIYVGGLVSSVDLANVERVEIIKGPQSAQYGRGTYAGAINYITRRPTEEFAGEVSIGAAQHESYSANAWVSGPLSEGLAWFRIAAGLDEYGGEHVNTITDKVVGDQSTSSVSAKLFLTPSEQFEATLSVGYQKVDDGHFAIALQGRNHNNCCFRGPQSSSLDLSGVTGPRAREYYRGEALRDLPVALLTEELDAAGGAGNRNDRLFASLAMHYELTNGWRLSSITGNIDDEHENFFDVTYGGYDFGVAVADAATANLPPFLVQRVGGGICAGLCGIFLRLNAYDQSDLSQELRLTSPADRALRATAGLYYYRGKRYERMERKVMSAATAKYGQTPGEISTNGEAEYEDVTNTAVFGSLEWDLGDQWTATLEARWANDEIRVRAFETDEATAIAGDYTADFDSVNPRATLRYQLNEDTNLYLNVSRGSKPGNFNTDVPEDAAGNPDESFRKVDEEVAWNYEAGYKARLMDRRMVVGVAAYRTEVEEQQFTTVIELASGSSTSILDNVGESVVNGLEVELEALVTEKLTLNLGYAWTQAEIRDYINIDQADLWGANGSLSDLQRLGSAAGQQVPRIPEHAASLVARYDGGVMASGFSWFWVADVVHEGSRFSQIHNLIETGDLTRVGLRLGVRGEALAITLWGRNLLDDDTPLDILRYIDRTRGSLTAAATIAGHVAETPSASTSPRGFAVTLPRGRQVGVTVNYSF